MEAHPLRHDQKPVAFCIRSAALESGCPAAVPLPPWRRRQETPPPGDGLRLSARCLMFFPWANHENSSSGTRGLVAAAMDGRLHHAPGGVRVAGMRGVPEVLAPRHRFGSSALRQMRACAREGTCGSPPESCESPRHCFGSSALRQMRFAADPQQPVEAVEEEGTAAGYIL